MSESRNHLRSVSDLYAADEIEVLLLEEIRDLEPPPTAYSKPEDIQDFEIAGSRTGGLPISSQSSDLDSPGVHSTVHSWDSHANYHYGDRRGLSGGGLHWKRSNHLVLYCDIQGHLKTTTGVLRLLLLISSAACLVTLCSSGTAKVSLFMLPLVGRLRLMIFVAVFCLLITALLLFLDISHVIYIFPFNWTKLNTWIFLAIGLAYMGSGGLIMLSVTEYQGTWVPRRTRSQLTVAAGISFFCSLLALLLTWLHGRAESACRGQLTRENTPTQLYKPVENSSSSGATIKEKSPKKPPSWVVKNQSKKRNVDSDRRESSSEKYQPNTSRKDHWASARQHFLPQNDDESDNVRRDDDDAEGRRRRRRKTSENTSTGGNGSLATSKTRSSHGEEEAAKPARRVPRKLPLQSVDRPQPAPRINPRASNAASQLSSALKITNEELEKFCKTGETRNVDALLFGLQWEATNKKTAAAAKEETANGSTTVPSTAWNKDSWRPPADDVQPCSSKTVDPYSYP